ncbi:hypothetical protein [Aeromicrobium sp.]|uniref:hypothetical protein n=1 Tax=Aeromicrobium sp. TaxID=1871063 RepID=UPI003C4ABCD8
MSDQGSGTEYPGYPGEGGPAYGNVPAPPTPSAALPAPERPTSLGTAVMLMWAGAALVVVSTVLGYATGDNSKSVVAEQMRDADPNVTQTEIDAAYVFGIAFSVVFAILAIGLWCWMAWKNGQGRSWARVVATVLGGLNILSTIVGLAVASVMGMPGASTAIGYGVGAIQMILAIVILVLLWQKSSTTYYNAISERQV